MGARDNTLQALEAYDKGHNTRVASFPPPSQNEPPEPSNGGLQKRDIPKDHAYDAKALKPMAKALWASSVALGHCLTAYRQLSRLKSATVSPDGLLGGRGYVMPVQDMRKKLFAACEALSGISDTLFDEISAPHWKPKLAQLDENSAEDVERFVEESQEVMENPEEEAEEKMDAIEKENDGKKGQPGQEGEEASQVPGGGPPMESQSDAAQVTPPKQSSTKQASTKPKGVIDLYAEISLDELKLPLDKAAVFRRARMAQLFRLENLDAWVELQASSVSPDELGGPRVDHIGPAEGEGPWGSYNDDEPPAPDAWGLDEGGSGRREDSGEDYDYPSPWENNLSHAAAWAKDVEAKSFSSPGALKTYLKGHPDADPSKHTVKKDEGGDGGGKKKDDGGKKSPWGTRPDKGPSGAQQVEEAKKQKAEEKAERVEKEKAERAKKPKPQQGFSPRQAPAKKEVPKKKEPWYKRLLKADNADVAASAAWATSVVPDSTTDDTPTEAWDFGIGYGAKGQGAGGYANPSDEGNDKGVWGPHAGLPGGPGQSSGDIGDTAVVVDQALNDRHGQGDEPWTPQVVSPAGQLPQDVAGPSARSDYYRGPKDNLVQAEHGT